MSDQGRIHSLRKNIILKPSYSNTGGYAQYILTVGGVAKGVYGHRLVAEEFIGSCPLGMEIRHKDGNPRNNVLSNLHFGTHSENMYDKRDHGRDHNAIKTHCARGHEFSVDNTYVYSYKDGTTRRQCRKCRSKNVATSLANRTSICTVDGCDRTQRAKGLCSRCYQRQRASRS